MSDTVCILDNLFVSLFNMYSHWPKLDAHFFESNMNMIYIPYFIFHMEDRTEISQKKSIFCHFISAGNGSGKDMEFCGNMETVIPWKHKYGYRYIIKIQSVYKFSSNFYLLTLISQQT